MFCKLCRVYVVIIQARAVSTDRLRPSFYIINAVVYTVQVNVLACDVPTVGCSWTIWSLFMFHDMLFPLFFLIWLVISVEISIWWIDCLSIDGFSYLGGLTSMVFLRWKLVGHIELYIYHNILVSLEQTKIWQALLCL